MSDNPNPQTMRLDECRKFAYRTKALSELTAKHTMEWAEQHWDDEFFGKLWKFHELQDPFPPTLDGAAAAMPEGWSEKIVVHRTNVQATAWPSQLDRLPTASSPYKECVKFFEASTEILARYRLAVACIIASQKESDQ